MLVDLAGDAPHDGEIEALHPTLPRVGSIVRLARKIDEHWSLRPPGISHHLRLRPGHALSFLGEASDGSARPFGRFRATVEVELELPLSYIRTSEGDTP